MSETILSPKGRLDSATAPAFEQEFLRASATGLSRLLIDFSELTYISSAGLRVVLKAAKRMQSEGGRVALCALGPQVAEVFDISGFSSLSIFSIHPARAAALAALR
jgi:anti-anti-sigma factor